MPEAPPEGRLIRTARKASGLTLDECVARLPPGAAISTSWWSSVEKGYQNRGGEQVPVAGSDGVIAQMAAVVGVSSERLRAVRPDAADILDEIALQGAASAAIPKPGILASGEVTPPASPQDELASFAAQIVREYPELADFAALLRGMPGLSAAEKLGAMSLVYGMRLRRDADGRRA
jgi:hypothetical protein